MGDSGLPPLAPALEPHISEVTRGIFLLEPLSRLGHGPGLIILTPGEDTLESSVAFKNFVPTSLMKWAEEGYAVVQIQKSALSSGQNILQQAIDALKQCRTCDQGNMGIVAYDVALWNEVESGLSAFPDIKGAIIYSSIDEGLAECSISCIQHLYGKPTSKLGRTLAMTAYAYPTSKSAAFASPVSPDYDYALEGVSHTRNLTFLKRHDIIGGPIFDLEAIWDEHCYYE